MKLNLVYFIIPLVLVAFVLYLYFGAYSSVRTLQIKPTPKPSEISIILGGDVMLGRTVMTTSLDLGNPRYPFEKLAPFLSSADLVFVNLENPLVESCPRRNGGMVFCADPVLIEGLVHAGVDVVTLANNHALNHGREGLLETVTHLNKSGIEATYDDKLVIKKVGETAFGFLGLDFLTQIPDEEIFELVSKYDKEVDVLIVGVHWGVEYTVSPIPKQVEWANRLVVGGADIIAGHHPHWVQSVDNISGVPVYYSLGNLVFDQMWSEPTKKGLLVKLVFQDKHLVSEEFFDTYISSWAQPEIIAGK